MGVELGGVEGKVAAAGMSDLLQDKLHARTQVLVGDPRSGNVVPLQVQSKALPGAGRRSGRPGFAPYQVVDILIGVHLKPQVGPSQVNLPDANGLTGIPEELAQAQDQVCLRSRQERISLERPPGCNPQAAQGDPYIREIAEQAQIGRIEIEMPGNGLVYGVAQKGAKPGFQVKGGGDQQQ